MRWMLINQRRKSDGCNGLKIIQKLCWRKLFMLSLIHQIPLVFLHTMMTWDVSNRPAPLSNQPWMGKIPLVDALRELYSFPSEHLPQRKVAHHYAGYLINVSLPHWAVKSGMMSDFTHCNLQHLAKCLWCGTCSINMFSVNNGS